MRYSWSPERISTSRQVSSCDVADVLAHGVGGALVPVGRLVGLLGGQHLDEAAAEGVELVGVGDVAVQADAEELRQDVDAVAGRC